MRLAKKRPAATKVKAPSTATSRATSPRAPDREAGQAPRVGVADAILIAASALTYLTALPAGFAQDDFYYFIESEAVLERPWTLFGAPFRDSGVYRPLTLATFSLNHAVGGLEPFGYHLSNLALHVLVVLLLFRILSRLAAAPAPAAAGRRGSDGLLDAPFAAALLFAVHPIHTEAVTAIVGRAELLSTGFVLGAWLLHLSHRTRPAAAAFLLALLCKEPALGFLALAPLGDWVSREGLRPSRYAAYAEVFLAWLALRSWAVGAPDLERLAHLENPLYGLAQPERALNAIAVAWRYVLLQLYPRTLSADYSFDSIPVATSIGPLLAPLVAAVAVFALWIWSARRHRRAFLAGGIYLAGFAITSNVPFLIPTILGERLAYLPSAGLCLLAGLGYECLGRHRRALAAGLLASAATVLAIRAAVRNLDWRDDFTLATATVEAYPRNVKTSRNLGVLLLERGDLAGARRELERAHGIDPEYPDLLGSLAVLEFQEGDLEGAIRFGTEAFRRSTAAHPKRPEFAANLAGLLIEAGRLDEARAILDESIAGGARSVRLFANRAVLHIRRSDAVSARADLQAVLAIDPNDQEAKRLLAELAR